MNTDPQYDALAPAAARLVKLVRHSLGDMSDEQRARGAQALRLRLETEHNRALPRTGGLALGAIAVALAAVAALYIKRSPANLSARVDGASLPTGGLVRSEAADSTVQFSDGSEIVLGAEGQLHVRSVQEHGAHITLDAGRAHVYVVHQPNTHWEFAAGPFIVDVIGTAFGISWNGATQEFDLRLENGAVRVSGPVLDGSLSLRPGQWLTVRHSDVRIRTIDTATTPAPSAAESPASAPATASATPATASATPATASATPATASATPATEALAPSAAQPAAALNGADATPSAQRTPGSRSERALWPSELAHGHYTAIVSDALRGGLDVSLSQSSVDELWALADAARYSRHPELARSALMAMRQRFASSSHARTAAFYLGRLAEASQDVRSALSWFGTYLSEAPNGTYASEALGRKMTLVQRLEGDAAARPIAKAYLQRFATGTYAEAARALTQ